MKYVSQEYSVWENTSEHILEFFYMKENCITIPNNTNIVDLNFKDKTLTGAIVILRSPTTSNCFSKYLLNK